MPKVSVIVPVYNPGSDIDACIESLLGQSMPAGDCELIFVDDGSTDGTPARLDELAARHAHVHVRHIPNSGWPGRPRNVGLDMAAGDFVYFVDNDDWLDERALERLHAMAVDDDADIVIGKVVGHGKASPRAVFRRNLHGVRFESSPVLLGLLTPHKLFRRAFVAEHGLRFPEGRRRLEDHVFVVAAYFHAERISVLADHPCYHRVLRGPGASASLQRLDPEGYFGDVREVLDLVERHTEPGPFRDRLLMHWYRGKMLSRVGGGGFLRRDPEHRRRLYEAVRALALERYGEDVHARLPLNLRVRSRLLRDGRYEALLALAEYESGLRARVRVKGVDGPVLRLEARLAPDRLAFVRRGEQVVWEPPPELRPLIGDEPLGDDTHVAVYVHRAADGLEYPLAASTELRLDGDRRGRVRPLLATTARLASPLPAGRWEVRAKVNVAGFADARRLRRLARPLILDPG